MAWAVAVTPTLKIPIANGEPERLRLRSPEERPGRRNPSSDETSRSRCPSGSSLVVPSTGSRCQIASRGQPGRRRRSQRHRASPSAGTQPSVVSTRTNDLAGERHGPPASVKFPSSDIPTPSPGRWSLHLGHAAACHLSIRPPFSRMRRHRWRPCTSRLSADRPSQ